MPANWVVETTVDGSSVYFYNKLSGEMRTTPPSPPLAPAVANSMSLSDMDPYERDDDLPSDSESNEIYQPEDDDDDLPDPIMRAKSPKKQQAALPPNWAKRTNHQGREYYCNLVTQETTWNMDDIDPTTGRLLGKARHTTPTLSSRGGDLNEGPDEEEMEADELTWAHLSSHIATKIMTLSQSIKQGGADGSLGTFTNQVIDVIRTMLLASGTIDKDSPYLRSSNVLRGHHRTMIASLSKVKLTAILCVTHQQQFNAVPFDHKNKLLSETNDLLVSVRNFVSTCQDIPVPLERIEPRLIDDACMADDAEQQQQQHHLFLHPLATRKKNDQAKYTLQHDLAENLDVYANNMHESIEAIEACLQDDAPAADPALCPVDERYQFGTRVFAQFRNLSSQTGQFLGLLDDIDYTTVIDHELLDALAAHKQQLSDALGKLFCYLQQLTSPDVDLAAIIALVLQHVQAIHMPIRTICDCINVMTDLHERATRSKQLQHQQLPSTPRKKQQSQQRAYQNGDDDSDIDIELPAPHDDDDTTTHNNDSVFSRGIFSYTTDMTEALSDKSMATARSPLSPTAPKKKKNASSFTAPSISNSVHAATAASVSSAASTATGDRATAAHLDNGADEELDEDGNTTHKSSHKLKKFFGDEVLTTPNPRKSTISMAAERPIYLGYDYDDADVAFNMEGNVRGGTLRALVERLTLHDYLDMNFNNTFLLTYRSFCSSSDLLDLLEARYNLTPPDDLAEDDLEVWRQKKLKLVRLRVFNVLKNWLEIYYNEEDHVILDRLMKFTDTVIRSTLSFSTDQLERLIKKRMENADLDVGGLKKLVWTPQAIPQSILPRNPKKFKLLDLDAVELARQLTIMDFKMYSSIRPIECLDKAWSRDNDDTNNTPTAVNIRASIEYCNQVTSWVSDAILSQSDIKKRSNLIKFWVQVAERCRELNNFNTCMAILSAFDNSSVGRLKRTWEMVGARTNQTLSHIRKIMGANRNFSEYRQLIHSVNPPCIPFLGIYLQDLTFIEDGNSNTIKTHSNHELINFAKREKTAEVIREIQQYQTLFYKLKVVDEIQEFIRLNLQSTRDEDQLYKESLRLEPREREDEKITRLLQESGFL
ncbi:ras guanine nucleotide exchange factor domain-containing protein [Gongronella butleri]|nr:ras guanine nucleotide exchange factor domain-containing protein [Gongronella butleri]